MYMSLSTITRSFLLGGAGALALGITGATGAAAAGPPPSATMCSDTAREAVVLPAVEELEETTGKEWDEDAAELSTFTDCRDLSYVVVAPEGATGSSPHHILLFHKESYLGTATLEAYGFEPQIEAVDDGKLAVTYSYIEGDEPNADPQGRAEATFTWDEAAGEVVMTGDVPPE